MANETPSLGSSSSKANNIETSLDQIIEPFLKNITCIQVSQILLSVLAAFFMAQQTFMSIFTDSLSTWSLAFSDNPIIQGLPTSSFFMGRLFGGVVLFFIGDSLGRKKLLFLSSFIMSVSAFFTYLSNNIWVYSGLRFITGCGCASIGTSALVLATESVRKSWKGKVGGVRFLSYNLGFLSLPIIGYLCRHLSWRMMYLVTSLPAFSYSLVFQILAYESPRWLLSQGRKDEGLTILKSFSSCQDLNFPMIEPEIQDLNLKGSSQLTFFYALKEDKEILKRLLLIMTIGCGNGIGYYGFLLGLQNIGQNIYISVALNALLEIPSTVLVLCIVSKWKRRHLMLSLSTLSGVCGVILCWVNISKEIRFGLELVSFFGICTTLNYFRLYTTELFPTSFRNSALAMAVQAVSLGGVLTPLFISSVGENNKLLPFGIEGGMLLIMGLLVILLPETLDALTTDEIE